MKKILLILFGITALFSFDKVNAQTIDLYASDRSELSLLKDSEKILILENKFYEVIDGILKKHNYYIARIGISGNGEPYLVVYSYDTSFANYSSLVSYTCNNELDSYYYFLQSDYSFTTSISSSSNCLDLGPLPFDISRSIYYPNNFYFSNMEIPYDSSDIANMYIEEELFLTLNRGDIIPTYKEIINPSVNNYISIDLNQYSYVSLSLKDYSKDEKFFTNVYVKGNYCITPVYNYGMTEKTEYYPGYQIDRCSPYYEDFTLVRTYILEQDLKNNAIYYLKAYDKTKDNIVKVDSSVFNITYITEEKKDNPYVSIGGKTYPTISYDNLSSSATKSEDEDYISGVVCQVGDFNCYTEYNPENIFDEIFSSPLKFLEDIWESVTSIFTLITEFISLLPPIMQSFLYLSFMVAVILGLFKIIL